MATSRICSIPACDKPPYTRGWCRSHYRRWSRNGDPLIGRTAKGDATRYFRDVVLSHVVDECLTWPFNRDRKGYGKIKHLGRPVLAHRLVCEIANGSSPTPDHQAAHSCGKGYLGCVAMRHLEWKTQAENEADKIRHGTARRA